MEILILYLLRVIVILKTFSPLGGGLVGSNQFGEETSCTGGHECVRMDGRMGISFSLQYWSPKPCNWDGVKEGKF